MGQVQEQDIVPSGWFIVTGASGSVGGEVVKGLAARGYAVILACRNLERGRRTADAVLREVPGARLRIQSETDKPRRKNEALTGTRGVPVNAKKIRSELF